MAEFAFQRRLEEEIIPLEVKDFEALSNTIFSARVCASIWEQDELARDPHSKDYIWKSYDSGLIFANHQVQKAFGLDLQAILAHRRRRYNALHAFGGTNLLTGLKPWGLDFGLAVSLTDKRAPERKEEEGRNNIHLLPADIYQPSTWERIRNSVASEIQERGFDFIYFDPIGGWPSLPFFESANRELTWLTANWLYQILNQDGGVMIGSFPGVASQWLLSWNAQRQRSMRKLDDLMTCSKSNWLWVERSPASLPNLPYFDHSQEELSEISARFQRA